MANEMTIEQCYTLANEVMSQATGRSDIAITDTSSFVNVAQTALKTGYDPVINAISQVLSRTIFSVRPYSAKFKGIKKTPIQYGNHIRKLQIADKDFSADAKFQFPVTYDETQEDPFGNGKSVDMYEINKPDILQTNFYGKQAFGDWVTIFQDQLDTAFEGPRQFGSFMTMVLTNMSDKHEQAIESLSRIVVGNFMGSLIDEGNEDRVIHLLTEYNNATGLSLTPTSVYQPDNFKAFMQWTFARVAQISNLMTERSVKFQTIVNNKNVMRHTPRSNQKVYMYAPTQYQISSMVMANTFNDKFLKQVDHEVVNFWQSIDTPDSIQITPSYIGSDGSVVTGGSVEQSNVFGCIFDTEALGFCEDKYRTIPTPLNAKGQYTNLWMHSLLHCYNDITEKGVVLLLD